MSTLTTPFKSTSTPASLILALAEGFATVKSNFLASRERRRVYGELSRMSDRDLADIGIGRGEIAGVAGYTEVPALALSARR